MEPKQDTATQTPELRSSGDSMETEYGSGTSTPLSASSIDMSSVLERLQQLEETVARTSQENQALKNELCSEKKHTASMQQQLDRMKHYPPRQRSLSLTPSPYARAALLRSASQSPSTSRSSSFSEELFLGKVTQSLKQAEQSFSYQSINEGRPFTPEITTNNIESRSKVSHAREYRPPLYRSASTYPKGGSLASSPTQPRGSNSTTHRPSRPKSMDPSDLRR